MITMTRDEAKQAKSLDQYLNLIESPIPLYRVFKKITGSLVAGVMLSQAWQWYLCKEVDDWLCVTQDEWQEIALLSRREQETARRCLLLLKAPDGTPVWEEQRRGIPARLYFRLNPVALIDVIDSWFDN